MVTDLAKYSHDVLKFNIAATGSLIALPYISLWLSSFIFGFIGDFSIKKGWHSVKTGRIIHTSIGIMIVNLFFNEWPVVTFGQIRVITRRGSLIRQFP